ncbi:MAG: hypothetical protein J6V11_03250, partial [Alphaproteobacteria bacterium]|nr:hypothetical protein [Alphaproteobacteria bacterium]
QLGGTNSFFFYAVIAMGLVVMVLKDMTLTAFSRALGLLGICFVSSYFLPSTVSIADGLGSVLTHVGLAIAWAILTWLFVQMDRVPFLSMTLSLVFAVFYFLLSTLLDIFEPAFGYLSITLVVVLLGINSYLKKDRHPKVGQVAAAFIGFIWGAMAVYVLGLGHITAVIVLYSYPIMEVCLSTMASIAFYQRFVPVYPFLIEQVIATKPRPEAALKFIMRWDFFIACLAILAVLNDAFSAISFYVVAIFLCINIYMRLKSWGEPTVRLRDVFKDAKDSVVYIKDEIKKMAENQKPKRQMKSDKVLATKSVMAEKTKLSAHSKVLKKSSAVTKKKTRQTTKKSPKNKREG